MLTKDSDHARATQYRMRRQTLRDEPARLGQTCHQPFGSLAKSSHYSLGEDATRNKFYIYILQCPVRVSIPICHSQPTTPSSLSDED